MARHTYDLRGVSQRDFEDFVFDHPVHPPGSARTWYHQLDPEILFDRVRNAACFIAMFEDAGSLLNKYPVDQLEQGFWAMSSAGFTGNVDEMIWQTGLPIQSKEALIHAMFPLYRDLFADHPLGEAAHMWWDGLAYTINPMKRIDRAGNDDHRRIQDAMFLTLVKILALGSPVCEGAALHGLNHVLHPDTVPVIEAYISKNPHLSDDAITYARGCAQGKAM